MKRTVVSKSDQVTRAGRVVALDVDDGTFRMIFSEAEPISGRLAQDFAGDKRVRVPGNYVAVLNKQTIIYHPTQEDTVTYQLVELRQL